jgi:hypothetical protein
MKSPIDRTLLKIERIPFSGCWIFMGALNSAGYGMVGLGRRKDLIDRAHRISYRAHIGNIPDGMFVCHTCDTPSCCNPYHLFLGTPKDNTQDMIKKNRHSLPPRNPHIVGSAHPGAKLHESQVEIIRELYRYGFTQLELSKEYGVARQTISKVVNYKRFKHV